MRKTIIYTLAILAFSMLLSSCGLYKKYERADMGFVDSLYRRMDTRPEDSISTASVSWDKIFTDPILQEWIRLGLEHNTDMNVAELKVQESQAYLLAARRALLPGLSFSASGGGFGGYFTTQLNASWDADIFGSLRNSKRKAEASLAQTEAYKHAVQTNLVASIANSYYMLLMLDEQLKISKRTLTTWEENIRAMEALKRAGKTNEAAVLQAKANMLNVEANILTLEKEILAVENSFCALLGTVPMEIHRSTLNEQKLPEKLYGDSQRIRQIIINLMGNAIKFTETGYVKLVVKTEPIDKENMNVIYQIMDTGQGMKEEDLDKLFGTYAQVDKEKNHHQEGMWQPGCL